LTKRKRLSTRKSAEKSNNKSTAYFGGAMRELRFWVFIITSSMATSAMAEGQYVLPKLGFMSINANNAKPLLSGGLLYGYGITPEITIEGEVNVGFTGGGYERKDTLGNPYETGNYKIWTIAGYGVYRLPITDYAYLKGKVGLLYEDIKRTSDILEQDTTGYGLAGGLGVGLIAVKKLTFEFEATGIDKNIIFYSFGFHYSF
jgi:hypothetical protein